MNKLALIILLIGCFGGATRARPQDLTVTASFTGQAFIHPDTPLEIRLNRALPPTEGRLALLIGASDVTNLCAVVGNGLRYAALPLPVGEMQVTVYLVAPDGEWRELARFPVRIVGKNDPAPPPVEQPTDPPAAAQNPSPAPQATPPPKKPFGFDKFDWVPSLNVGFKSQFAELHFPDANRPQRATFIDATLSGSLRSDLARGPWQMQGQYDVIGSSFRTEALRFGVLANDAPLVDLSSYLMQFQRGTQKLVVGHTGYGAQRHLINNFSSRGLTFTFPLTTRLDFALAAMNSTSIVGWSNFFGVDKTRHRLFSGTLGIELIAPATAADAAAGTSAGPRPKLRLEVGMLDAWFQPLVNFNQGAITDAERSRGGTARVLFNDRTQRVRLDASFTRSRFINADDPLLTQGLNVVAPRGITRNSQYADVSFELFKDFLFVKPRPQPAATDQASNQAQGQTPPAPPAEPRKFNLTLNVRHERVEPLYRSIGAQTQADRFQNQAEAVGTFGEISFTGSYTRFNDNLAEIPTLLRTLTSRAAFNVNVPLSVLFAAKTGGQPSPYLPRLGFTFDRVRALAPVAPRGFDDPTAIPDQANLLHNVTAEWQFTKHRVTYQVNHSLTDNRQAGRERADLRNFVHNVAFGWDPRPTLQISFETNFENANNREQAGLNRTLRFGVNTNWQATPQQTWNVVFSTIGAGGYLQRARTNNNRNVEFDLQWSYRLTRESPHRFKKVQTNYFIRFADRYVRTRDFLGDFNSLTRLRTLNTGLNFIFF